MKETIQDFCETVETASERLLMMTDEQSMIHPAPGKWSPKQIIGHLIDSAANNHQRFIRAQFKDDLVFPGYEQEYWVSVQNYQQESWNGLVQLWKLYNLHIAHVIEFISEERLKRPCRKHNLNQIAWKVISEDEPATLEYMIVDYIGHMKNHLNQIFP
ncbi:MAG TPA: DinB family protein [Blastocatellia bacterium]|nr:DinB family protein [Blastocatellia bacterium]